jgi:mycothiol synthase
VTLASVGPSYHNEVPLTVEGPNDGQFRWMIVVDEDRTDINLRSDLDAALESLDGGATQLWIKSIDASADAVALAAGFKHYRDLWQLRCPLPTAPSHLHTRGFTPDDLDDYIAVNNRAFSWHPEQGGLTRESVEATMAEPWFDADGFRLYYEDNKMVGFCWTKIHRDQDPVLGEIYVIAIDTSHHGLGLGKPMSLAGLDWLAAKGLTTGMLYVESDNQPANSTYASIGFTRHHTDRAYQLAPR